MKGLVRSTIAAALTLSGSALANPIMVVSEVYVEQFPGTSHVQVTRTYSSGASSTTAVTRDGASVAVTFEARSGGSRDLGSGMSNLTTVVGCDCSVAVGHHSYVVAGITVPLDVREASATSGSPRAPSAQCDVKCTSGIPAGGAGGTSSSTSGAGVGNTSSSSTGGVGAGGTSSSTSGAGVGNTSPSTGGVGLGGTSSSTGGASVGGSTPSTGGIGTGGTSPSKSTTAPTTGNIPSSATGGAPSNNTTSSAPSKNDSGESSGCAMTRTTTGLLPLGILAALGLLAFRRRK